MSWMETLYGGIIIGVAVFLWREFVYPVLWGHQRREHQIDLVEDVLREQTALYNPRPLAERIVKDLTEEGDPAEILRGLGRETVEQLEAFLRCGTAFKETQVDSDCEVCATLARSLLAMDHEPD